MSSRPFDGRVVVITGASRGIGAETARRFARLGANVALSSFDGTEGLGRVAHQCRAVGIRVTEVDADLAAPDSAVSIVEACVSCLGGIDVLLNNAFWEQRGDVADVACEGWDRTLAVSLRAPMLLAKAALPHFYSAGGGSIVNVASAHALASAPHFASYETAKAGLSRAVSIDSGGIW